MFEDPVASSYVGGIGVHWYADEISPISQLTSVHEKHPEKFLLYTEACNGWLDVQGKYPKLGNFHRAERYAFSIINVLNHWVTGWTDWSMILDMTGGQTWVPNPVDAPIIVDKDAQEFYKQPMYYAMAHF
ncbi:hypothetical protein PMAYCL1PPCAC_25074, partial [Pristionchus mayeri]